MLREVAEETSQEIILGELIKVQTSHWVGRSPYGTIEDFHAVRLIYRASCPHPTDPVVLDQGGTTEAAQWVPLESWRSVSWTQNWQLLLSELLKDSSANAAGWLVDIDVAEQILPGQHADGLAVVEDQQRVTAPQ